MWGWDGGGGGGFICVHLCRIGHSVFNIQCKYMYI